jgi:ABC-type antimicrobial peptide transport system permease subunit
VAIEGRAGDGSATARGHHHAAVAGDYWRVMGIPFLRGKPFENEFNSMSHPRVCIIDQAVANAYWRDSDPIGQRLSFGASFDPSQAITVVGVVGTVKQEKLTETQPMGTIYSPYVEYPTSWFRAVLRTQLPPAAMAETLRKVAEKMDPELVVTPIITMEQMIDDSLLARRSPAILAAIFAGIALVLATVGTYGVLACAVSYRRREIGIRMALGALPEQIVRLFLNMGARLLLGGCILGLAVAWATGRAMQRFLFEVGSFSPLVMGGVSALMAGVVFTAIIIPAVRAAAVDPCETLRHD